MDTKEKYDKCRQCDGTGLYRHNLCEKCSGRGRIERPGDQPMPTINENPYIQNLVLKDIKARLQLGIERYGIGLQANNGRDMLKDAYEEVLDLTIYLRGVLFERDGE